MTTVGERHQRDRMLRDLKKRGISDPRVLEAMGRVPRHRFVRQQFQNQAYGGYALPSRADQTISQPYIVARTTELLALDPSHSVLEIGTGTGYHTAVLALLAQRVYSLERVHDLATVAIQRIRELGYDNVKIQTFDGTVGWSEVAPFDRILVTAGAPHAPRPLLDQLKIGGRLLIPEGSKESQRLVLYERESEGYARHEGEAVAFVPLLGRHGW